MIRLHLPGWHVVPKARPRVTSRGTYMPPGYQDWKQETRMLLVRAYDGRAPLEGHLSIEVAFVSKKKPRGDMDNLLGAVLDAGNGVVWQDDRHAAAVSACWLQPDDEYQEGIYVEVTGWTPKRSRAGN